MLRAGLYFRTSFPDKLSATQVEQLRRQMGVQVILDLRSPEERTRDGQIPVFANCVVFQHKRYSWKMTVRGGLSSHLH